MNWGKIKINDLENIGIKPNFPKATNNYLIEKKSKDPFLLICLENTQHCVLNFLDLGLIKPN